MTGKMVEKGKQEQFPSRVGSVGNIPGLDKKNINMLVNQKQWINAWIYRNFNFFYDEILREIMFLDWKIYGIFSAVPEEPWVLPCRKNSGATRDDFCQCAYWAQWETAVLPTTQFFDFVCSIPIFEAEPNWLTVGCHGGYNKLYPLVNVYITMENHHFSWENPLEMAMFNSKL